MLSSRLKCATLQNIQKGRVVAVTNRFATTQTEFKTNEPNKTANEINLKSARPFEEIPGPTKYDLLRGLLPGGFLYKKSTGDMTMALAERYGKIFRIPGFFGQTEIIAAMNPDDYQLVYRHEGIWPQRRALASLIYYRTVHRPDVFQGIEGLTSTSGEKWAKVRTAVNPVLMQPKNAKLYLNTMLEVTDEFLERIRDIRDPMTNEMPETFFDEIQRLSFELVASVALNTQLGLIRKNRDSEECQTLLTSIRRFNDLTFDLEILPSIWKIIKTPKFYELMRTLDILTNICIKYINEALDKIANDTEGKLTTEVGKEKSVLEKLLRIDKRIAVAIALDMMMAGVDTTSSTLTGILFCIAKNPDKQAKLLAEITEIMPQKDSRLTLENMRQLPYLRACIKEGIRLYPIIGGTMRRMTQDVALSGYRVKANVDVLLSSNLLLRNEKFVPRANEFLPERWLRDDVHANELLGLISNPFMYLPFGFGPRSCVGKRIVDLELEISVARLVRNFNIEFNYSLENAFTAKLLSVPNIPLKFKFEERKV